MDRASSGRSADMRTDAFSYLATGLPGSIWVASCGWQWGQAGLGCRACEGSLFLKDGVVQRERVQLVSTAPARASRASRASSLRPRACSVMPCGRAGWGRKAMSPVSVGRDCASVACGARRAPGRAPHQAAAQHARALVDPQRLLEVECLAKRVSSRVTDTTSPRQPPDRPASLWWRTGKSYRYQ